MQWPEGMQDTFHVLLMIIYPRPARASRASKTLPRKPPPASPTIISNPNVRHQQRCCTSLSVLSPSCSWLSMTAATPYIDLRSSLQAARFPLHYCMHPSENTDKRAPRCPSAVHMQMGTGSFGLRRCDHFASPRCSRCPESQYSLQCHNVIPQRLPVGCKAASTLFRLPLSFGTEARLGF